MNEPVSAPVPAPVAAWHAIAAARDPAGLADLLADDVVFLSPAVHRPQAGRELTTAYLTAALAVLGPNLSYVHEWYGEDSAVLEFRTELDGLSVQGVDILRWNPAGQLVEFTVMIRPLRGLQQVVTRMAAQLGLAPTQS